MKKLMEVTKETKTGRNISFRDVKTNEIMARTEVVRKIEKNLSHYGENYYVRKQNGLKTPVSKPDAKTKNNLD